MFKEIGKREIVKREIKEREIREKSGRNSILFGWIEIEKRMSRNMDREKFTKMKKTNLSFIF
ncbi:unnamed protein product [Trifolium pratense]|uniref:Uncharacterized protein n=1 Tax=Trifolium pratense TaxID=57577 RepID=A0ACB0KXY7_TRIPR|nr:unnamed protein product [Trifolium pratense]